MNHQATRAVCENGYATRTYMEEESKMMMMDATRDTFYSRRAGNQRWKQRANYCPLKLRLSVDLLWDR
jgi:hypothetical protein